MIKLSTTQAARKLGIHVDTLAHYVAVGKVPAPEIVQVGKRIVHMWTEAEVENLRKLLPKIANGRKTRYQKNKNKKAQPRAAMPHKSRKPKKK